MIDSLSTQEINEQKANFITAELKRLILQLRSNSTCDVKRIDNNELKQRQIKLQIEASELTNVASKLKELIEHINTKYLQ